MKLIEGDELRRRLEASPPLIEHMVDPSIQIQMDGVDFTLREVSSFHNQPGAVDFDNTNRVTPQTEPLATDGGGWWRLGNDWRGRLWHVA